LNTTAEAATTPPPPTPPPQSAAAVLFVFCSKQYKIGQLTIKIMHLKELKILNV